MDGLPAASSTSGSSSVLVLVVELVVVLGMSMPVAELPRSSPSSTTRTMHIENRLSMRRE